MLLAWQRAELGQPQQLQREDEDSRSSLIPMMVQILKLANKYFQVAIIDMLRDIKENTPINKYRNSSQGNQNYK